MKILVMPAKWTMASSGTVATAGSRRVSIAALAKLPDLRAPFALGSCTSTSNVRVVGSTAGLIRVTVPSKVLS